jgi:2-haloacid dehalogenase
MNFSHFSTISFDCYGTLIDWEAGILPVLRRLLVNHGQSLSDAEILELYGEFEAAAESGPYQSYREVLQSVVRAFAEQFHFETTAAEIASLAESVHAWPPFLDTVAALRELQKRYKLVIISNIDDDLFAGTRKHLEVEFDAVITAEQARSYKPSINNFQMALRRLAISPNRLLHAAQSVYHDVVPARSLEISTVWVNRKSARPGVGAVRAWAGKPDLEVPDLASLAAAVADAQS